MFIILLYLYIVNSINKKPRVQRTRGDELLPRQNEHKLVVRIPGAVGMAIAGIQPTTLVNVSDAEGVQKALRIANGFHSDDQPLILGLVQVLQAQLGTNFRRTQLETQLLTTSADLSETRIAFETEIFDGHSDEVDFRRLCGSGEFRFPENVASPVTESEIVVSDGLAELVSGFEAGAEFDRFPNRNFLSGNHENIP